MRSGNSSKRADAEALVQAILRGESDNALYWTCMCLRSANHHLVEDAWIELSARIGAKQVMPFRDTWMSVNRALLQLINEDSMHISDALQMTGMLFILFHRQNTNQDQTKHFSTLRKEILDYFPEGASLSHRGQLQMARILPNPGSPTYPFVQRVLAGFGKLIDQQDSVNVHRALEYISRKKLQLPLPHVWPAPTTELADKGDPLWFLWGGMLLFLPGNENVDVLWNLYQHQWKPSTKTQRAGLLWGVAHLLQQGVGYVWSKEEAAILEKVGKMAPDLWASINEVEGERQDVEENGSQVGKTNLASMDVLQSFVPRADPSAHRTAPVAPRDPGSTRVLHLRRDKASASEVQNQRNLKPSKYIEPSASDTLSHPQHETRSIDPRYRWLDFGTKRE